METTSPILGLDFGGVINDGRGHPSGDDTAFLLGGHEAAMATPMMTGAVESIRRLNTAFGGQIWIISKCGPRIQQRSEQWLEFHHFFESTGVDPTHIRFCRQRPEKADHCAELGVTHFVDDRSDVLNHLVGIVEHLYLFDERARAETDEVTCEVTPEVTSEVTPVHSWTETESAIMGSLVLPDVGVEHRMLRMAQ